jgi:predicted nucleotidyltransferase
LIRKITMAHSLAETVKTLRIKALEIKKKLAKVPQNPEEVIPEFSNDYHKIYGEDLISIILYGSGARGDYIPGRSDLNFLICLTEEGIKGLSRALKVVAKWHRWRVATPLFMTREYIAASLDTFPLEFLNIRRSYRVVWGDDPLAKIDIQQKQLRLQLEREVKGKLLQLREAYIASEGRGRNLAALASSSLTAMFSIFQGILYLRGKEIPHQRVNVIHAIAEEMGLTAEPFVRLLEVKEGRAKLSRKKMKEVMEAYIEEERRLASWLDMM